ncbi:MAG: GTPase ObgE [Gemmatimonadetes bacterium]|nr:GTPase ObgE [Gemmatimonadota bacterium]
MFIDRVTITVEAGTGGSGAEAFRRESGVPRGGPSGGDGGSGGSVVLVCDSQLSTLLDFRYRSEYKAPRGGHGEGGDRTGRSAEDLELRVPPGTIAKDQETGDLLGELVAEGARLVIARGGRGGRGNASFATATQQAPRYWEPGEEGVRRTVDLTLKLIADVGLVGEPNAGKSTLLASVSAARPKVADYPFTTLTPQLGVVQLPDLRSYVMADIPGIIEGAHEGKGLGHRFLQHIERTRTLALLIPVDDPDPQGTYDRLRDELARYSEALARRPHCVVLTKADLLGPKSGALDSAVTGAAPGPAVLDAGVTELRAPEAWGCFVVSSVSRRGLAELLEALWSRVQKTESEGVDLGGKGIAEEAGAGSDEGDWWSAADRES